MGACSELVFAPIDEMFPDDAPLLPSGFRIIPLDSKTVEFLRATPEKSFSFFFFLAFLMVDQLKIIVNSIQSGY